MLSGGEIKGLPKHSDVSIQFRSASLEKGSVITAPVSRIEVANCIEASELEFFHDGLSYFGGDKLEERPGHSPEPG